MMLDGYFNFSFSFFSVPAEESRQSKNFEMFYWIEWVGGWVVVKRNQVNVLELHYSYSGKFRNAVKDNGENIKFSMSTSTKNRMENINFLVVLEIYIFMQNERRKYN